ncbi:MAG: trypco2 family protein [Bacteroidales bacterium]
MELKNFIQNVLEQMAEIKGNTYKKSYLVEELEFELTLTETNDGKIGVEFLGIGGHLNEGSQNSQKVRVKLKPKQTGNKKIEIEI